VLSSLKLVFVPAVFLRIILFLVILSSPFLLPAKAFIFLFNTQRGVAGFLCPEVQVLVSLEDPSEIQGQSPMAKFNL